MHTYHDLFTLISRETNSRIPRAAAQIIARQFDDQHPTATHYVLFRTRQDWTVLPVGPNEAIKSVALASRTRTSHGRAVASCPRLQVTQSQPAG